MFENERYITSGIEAALEPALQNMLWYLIEAVEVKEKSNLQVFELSVVHSVLHATHSQEQPDYCQTHALPGFAPVAAKVFVIDDGDHSTMLLANEY
ncbi:DUF960 domain-containing protein [Ruminococcaceae bacterium OttesenSCG-928-D13]|nr:DUF960 domain-containing protein [Ruminococcaceae bacterium OttesenSCG-928-D13]